MIYVALCLGLPVGAAVFTLLAVIGKDVGVAAFYGWVASFSICLIVLLLQVIYDLALGPVRRSR